MKYVHPRLFSIPTWPELIKIVQSYEIKLEEARKLGKVIDYEA